MSKPIPNSATRVPAGSETGENLIGATEKLLFTMRRALVERRQTVELGAFKFRFLRCGEHFSDGNASYEALQTGVFAYFSASSGGAEVSGRWVHHGSSDDLEAIVSHYTKGMSAGELDKVGSIIQADSALQSMFTSRASARRKAAETPASVPSAQPAELVEQRRFKP